MPLTDASLENGDIYKEETGKLSERIDLAWEIYSDNKRDRGKKEALEFLIYAFDIISLNDINGQLILLMEEKQKYKATNPDYIPGKTPENLQFDPRQIVPSKTSSYGYASNENVKDAIKQKELLDVNNHSKALDVSHSAIFLTAEERAKHRVHIHKGEFKKDGKNFDTGTMQSHNKSGFAAYTLNANGELSVFNHFNMNDNIAHSSMNAGSPVVAAGELKIENGVLKAITTHSGHYRPTLFNIYRLLEHFSKNNVDLSQAKVLTFGNPSNSLPTLQSKSVTIGFMGPSFYQTSAIRIYKVMDDVLKENIASINQQVKSYKEGGFISGIYKLKDAIMGSNLTQRRENLAKEFADTLSNFQKTITKELSPDDLNHKIEELQGVISDYQTRNQELSCSHHKNESSGRLTSKMSKFKEQIEEIKKDSQQNEVVSNIEKTKNIN